MQENILLLCETSDAKFRFTFTIITKDTKLLLFERLV